MSDKSTLNVLYLTDDNYAVFAGVSILSLFENNKNISDITVYVIDDSISEMNKEKFKSMAKEYGRKIVFLDLSKGIETLKALGAPTYRNSYTTYLKLFTFDLLPDDVHRIFFIDSDSIVVGDLSGIIDVNMEGKMLAAVCDGMSHSYKVALGYPETDSWYNMGVVLVDVDMWKREKAQDKVIEQLKKRNAYIAVDQDILNITQHNNIATLHPKYNATPHHYVYSYKGFMRAFPQGGFYSEELIRESEDHALIRHFERFVGESPWHKNSIHPYTELFDKYLSFSLWNDYEKMPAKKSFVLKIEKILYTVLPHEVFLYIWAFAFRRYLKKYNDIFGQNMNIKNIS